MAGGYVLDQLIGEGAERLIQAGISQGRNAHEAVRFERALRGVTRVAGTIGAARTGGKIGGGKGRSTLEYTSKGLLTSAFSKDIKACVRDVEAKSGIPLTKEHRQLLKKDMQQNQYRKLEGEAKQLHKDSYTSTVKERLQKEWSDHYKHPWPTTPRLNKKKGKIEPVPHQFHHIIPQQVGDPHTWWNGHPVPQPGHQSGIHGKNAPLTKILKDSDQ